MPQLGLGLGSQKSNLLLSSSVIPLSELSLWLKSDDGLTTSPSPTTFWLDKSGKNNDITFSDDNGGSDYATYVASAINGKPALRINPNPGQAQAVYNLSFTGITTNQSSVFIVARKTINSATQGIAVAIFDQVANTTCSAISFKTLTPVGPSYISAFNGIELISPNAYTIGTWTLISCIFNGASSKLSVNGSLVASGNTGFNVASNQQLIYAYYYDASEYESIDTAESIIYNRVVTDAEAAKINSYLKTKYAL
jgi:hypothetical protein